MTAFRFSKQHRLSRADDFRRAFDQRCSAGDDRLVVFACENGLPHARLGLSVSRKLGTAVFRNRWKRLIREAFRLSQADLPVGIDLVVVPRREVLPTLGGVQQSLLRLAARAAARLRRPSA
jgi:ribonuclease P protein component